MESTTAPMILRRPGKRARERRGRRTRKVRRTDKLGRPGNIPTILRLGGKGMEKGDEGEEARMEEGRRTKKSVSEKCGNLKSSLCFF